VIGALGGELGHNLLEADENNPRGYFEDSAVVAIQERFHAESAPWIELGASLPDPRGSEERHRDLESRAKTLETFLVANTGDADRPRVIKDPRTARFLDAWKLAADRLGITLEYVLCLRQPVEVIDSLIRRDNLPWSRAALIWVQHHMDLVRYTDARFAVVVEYSDWFANPIVPARALIHGLKLPWQGDDKALIGVLRKRIDPALRHHQASDLTAGNPVLMHFYELLRETRKPENRPQLLEFAAWLGETEVLYHEWAQAVRDGEKAIISCREELERAGKVWKEQQAMIAQQMEELERAGKVWKEQQAMIAQQMETIRGLSARLEEAAASWHEQESAIADCRRNLSKSRAELDAVYKSTSWRLTALIRFLKRAVSPGP
jgi:hypothetical protein